MGDTHQSPDTSLESGQNFGDTLRRLRRAAGLTQADLAERSHLSLRGIADLERGVIRHPRRETLLALAEALGLAEDEEDRERFFEAARRRPSPSSVSGSPPTSTAEEPESTPATSSREPTSPTDQAPAVRIFLIADVRGYTSYTYEHRDEEAAKLALRFAAISGAAVQAHGGQVLEVRGDEVLALFSSVRAALRSAITLQDQLARASRTTPEQPICCGIGLESGEAISVPGGFRGLALNLAVRLCAQAGPGEVLAGETVIGLARKVEGLVFLDRGLVSLKGFATPVRVTQVVAAERSEAGVWGSDAVPTGRGFPAPEAGEPIPARSAAVGNFLSAQPRHRLVAREREMAILRADLDVVQAGTGRLVLVVGEPGVGKTRLAQEVLQAADERGFWVVTGRCYAPQETVPYYPFLEVLSRAYAAAPLAIRTALPTQWPEVGRLIPDRSIAMPAATSPVGGGAEYQQRLFWQVTGFLEALAEERPLALLLDDLHWMDGSSLELLLHLARHTRDCPILLLATYRGSEVPWQHPLATGVRDLSRAQLVEQVDLSPFTRDGTAALLAATMEEGEISEAVTDVIYAPTDGNAFFAQEVLRTLVGRGDIVLINGCWQPLSSTDVVVPENVRAAVLERVVRLSAAAQEMLGLASVLVQRFLFDDLLSTLLLASPTLATVTGTPWGERATSATKETALEAVLEEAVEARVLREVGGAGYAFTHALAQRALYEQLSARRRRRGSGVSGKGAAWGGVAEPGTV